MIRERFHKLIWLLLLPVRWYMKAFPFPRGKGLLKRFVLLPLLPPPSAEFAATLPDGSTIDLRYRETLGFSTLMNGTFERAEISWLTSQVSEGATVIDIGANVGLFSVPLAKAVGENGQVFAFEPVTSNVERLKRNLSQNHLDNVTVFAIALGREDGFIDLHLADDPAFPSTDAVSGNRATGERLSVSLRRLDTVWHDAGSPPIQVIKLDVEGAEVDVLEGARSLLETCEPLLMIEANTKNDLAELEGRLSPLGYNYSQPAGFAAWNYIFECRK